MPFEAFFSVWALKLSLHEGLSEGTSPQKCLWTVKEIREFAENAELWRSAFQDLPKLPRALLMSQEEGTDRRLVGETDLNAHSSRSHSLFTVWLEKTEQSEDGDCKVRPKIPQPLQNARGQIFSPSLCNSRVAIDSILSADQRMAACILPGSGQQHLGPYTSASAKDLFAFLKKDWIGKGLNSAVYTVWQVQVQAQVQSGSLISSRPTTSVSPCKTCNGKPALAPNSQSYILIRRSQIKIRGKESMPYVYKTAKSRASSSTIKCPTTKKVFRILLRRV